MRSRTSWSWVTCLVAAGCAGGASLAHAITWAPYLSLDGRYDDNVLHRPQGADDVVSVATPGLKIFNRDPITSYDLDGSSGFTSYSRTHLKTSRRDIATLDLTHNPGYFEKLDLNAWYQRSADPIDFRQGTVTQRGDVSSAGGTGELSLFRVGAAADVRRWDYADGQLADGRSTNVTGRLFPVNTRSTRFALEARRSELEVGDGVALQAGYETASFRRQHSDNFWSELEAGRVEARFRDGTRKVHSAIAASFSRSSGGARTPVTLSVRVADDIATTVDAGLTGRGAGRSLGLRYETRLDADGGLYRVPTLSRRGTLDASDTLGGRLVIDANGSFARIRAFHGSGPGVDQWRAEAGISKPIGPWLTARVAYDFLRQDVPLPGSDSKFDRSRYSIGFTLAPAQ